MIIFFRKHRSAAGRDVERGSDNLHCRPLPAYDAGGSVNRAIHVVCVRRDIQDAQNSRRVHALRDPFRHVVGACCLDSQKVARRICCRRNCDQVALSMYRLDLLLCFLTGRNRLRQSARWHRVSLLVDGLRFQPSTTQ